jgi:hypothetical protein
MAEKLSKAKEHRLPVESIIAQVLDKCVRCDVGVEAGSLVVVRNGIDTLLANCKTAGETMVAERITNRQQKNLQVKIHEECRMAILNKKRKAEKSVTSVDAKRNRSTRGNTCGFSFKGMCFFCGLTTSGSSAGSRKVLTKKENFDRKVHEMIAARGDCNEWALEVKGRIAFVHDLRAADAEYHTDCYGRFANPACTKESHQVKRGRPKKESARGAFEKLCEQLESEGENDLYTLRELHDMMQKLHAVTVEEDQVSDDDDEYAVYGKDYLKSLLIDKYGSNIHIVSANGRQDVVGFTHFCDYLLRTKYNADRQFSEGTEAERLVKQAADVILAEIREQPYNKEFYPTATDINCDGSAILPPLLQLFLKSIIRLPLKQGAIGQALVQATRPSGCLMPIPFCVGVELAQCGVNEVHMKLARLGYSLSVDEIARFKQSIMQPSTDRHSTDTSSNHNYVTHFVADNVDHNTCTLDGRGTFHGMGIISTTASVGGTFGNVDMRVRRLKNKPQSAMDAIRDTSVKIMPFDKHGNVGLEGIKLCAFQALRKPLQKPAIVNLNCLWHVAGMSRANLAPRPGWSGYMQSVCRGSHPGVSSVSFLTIVDLNPSEYDCIHSTLLFVIEQAGHYNIQTPDITFDQPLYIKAVEVAMKARLNVVIRLGGFHTIMNFLGSLGHLMRGSGLEEVFSEIFGPNTVEHIFTGKAYSRAVRAHFIAHAALTDMLLDFLSDPVCDDGSHQYVVTDDDVVSEFAGSLSPYVVSALVELYKQTVAGVLCDNDEDTGLMLDTSLVKVDMLMQDFMRALSTCSRMSRFWISYMTYVDLLKLFILAERTANWSLHLDVVVRMLPLFAATGHGNYAKSARLYVQQMRDLAETHPLLHEQFMSGYHSIRRSDRYWAGLSMDLVIEQTMMRSIKSRGGLTRGRGMHETSRVTWLSTMTECARVRMALSSLTGVGQSTSQHVEVGASRRRRDFVDLSKVKVFLQEYSPFRFTSNTQLVSICSGFVAGPQEAVNCDEAEEVGCHIHDTWDKLSYSAIVLRKASHVKTMAHVKSSSNTTSNKIAIEPSMLFHRLILVGERKNEIKQCFDYELTTFPMSLFKDGLTRKPRKPDLYRKFAVGFVHAALPDGVMYVVDGGFLLHKVRWHAPSDVCDILPLFVSFLNKLGPVVCVVFDGYGDQPSTKYQEHARRALQCGPVSPSRKIDCNTKQVGQQEPFLANMINKNGFIQVLMEHLRNIGVTVMQADGDADTLIVHEALQSAVRFKAPVAVLAEDTDILALMLHHSKPNEHDVYLVCLPKTTRNQQRSEGKVIRIRDLQTEIGSDGCEVILVAHAYGGCDTTSAIHGHGKGAIFNKIVNSIVLMNHCRTLQSATATRDDVCSAGVKLMVSVYGGKASSKLGEMRHSAYNVRSLKCRFSPESLPPSQSAAEMHSLRVHWQAVAWGSSGSLLLPPTDWGWKLENSHLTPIQIEGNIAPDHVLNVIRCSCTARCSSMSCSCRKHNLKCVSACTNCHGTDCCNASTALTDSENDDTDTDNELSDVSDDADGEDMPDFLWDDELYFQFEESV